MIWSVKFSIILMSDGKIEKFVGCNLKWHLFERFLISHGSRVLVFLILTHFLALIVFDF